MRRAGGSSVTIGLLFSPEDAVRYEGALAFDTNDPDQPTVEIPLTGAGSDAPVCTVIVQAPESVSRLSIL